MGVSKTFSIHRADIEALLVNAELHKKSSKAIGPLASMIGE